MQATVPSNESRRLRALREYEILDTGPEPAFDDLARIAAQICMTPMALVSLVDDKRQWFKARFGLAATETSREVSFCAHAILRPGLFIVPDAAQDPRFFDNALVTGEPGLRFYAGALLHTPDGHALGTLCVLDRTPRDLDEPQKAALEALARQAMAQMELRRALRAAERVNRYRSRLMAVMGHDLKQPVHTLQMALDVLSRRLASSSDREIVGYANMALDQLDHELDSLAQASRLDQEGVQMTEFPLQGVMDGLYENWAPRARLKGLRLRARPSAAVVRSDERLLGTILGNFVGNAIKYTQKGGVLVAARRRGDAIRIEVWDTGRGIPETQLEKIFESFYRLDGACSEGLGLGLAIARRTAELLDYEISVSSRLGKGSCFAVTIGAIESAARCGPEARFRDTTLAQG
jgi:signal transduction histidine kinase